MRSLNFQFQRTYPCPCLRPEKGFTVIEMLVVMTVIALLLSVIAPSYVRHIDRARETVLKQNLITVRDAMDKFKADKGRFPTSLQELVAEKYLRAVPMDPLTDRADTWVLTPSTDGSTGISDLHTSSPAKGLDGTPYASW